MSNETINEPVRRTLLAAALLAGCTVAGTAAAAAPKLTGQSWQLVKLGTVDRRNAGITAVFTVDGKVSGFSGCNTYSGTYTTSGSSIKVGHSIAATQKACPSPVMATEDAYLTALTSARTYVIVGRSLTMRSAARRTLLVFAVQSQLLAGTSWNAIAYNNGKAIVSVIVGTKIDAKFGKNDVSGFAGCNTYSGTVNTTPPKIAIGPLTSTRKSCSSPAGVMSQESAYLAALGSASTYTLQGSQLELHNSKGHIAVTLRRAS